MKLRLTGVMRKEKEGKRGKKKMDERQEDMEKEVGEDRGKDRGEDRRGDRRERREDTEGGLGVTEEACEEISAFGSFNDTPDYVPPAFNTFKPVTEDEVRKCINESPTKSCLLDPIPTFLLRDCLDILLPSITKLVNYSLSDGSFPSAFKRAVVTPLIKKASLPKNDLKNYRPVSGLCFLSKLVE